MFLSAPVAAQDASTGGQWGPVIDWPLVAVSMANLPDGRILTYSGSERRTWPVTEQTYSVVWDPVSGQFDETLHVGHNMFCAATTMTEDGKVFVNGGRNASNSPWTSLFDSTTSSWTQIENMASGGRWYPTAVAMGNGDIFTAMGNSTNVANPDLWSVDSGWRVLNGINFLSMRERHNELGRENVFPLLSQAPDGSIYHFWDTVENHRISTAGNGSSLAQLPDTDNHSHAGGVQTMYDEGKLLVTGNNDGSWGGNSSAVTASAFTVDLNNATPVIRSTQSMRHSRKFHQLINLPTGEVLVVGGNTTGAKFQDNGSVFEPELWNPGTGQWRPLAPMTIPRDYHSTALLMVDGRVITAGGGYDASNPSSGGTHQDAQIYSPPYLFNEDSSLAERPTIQSDLDTVAYGQTFTVSTTGSIDYFNLVKMSSTSHAMNSDARQFRPEFHPVSTDRYAIVMHDNPNVATPGYWMLFAVNSSGVPSIADVIRIDLSAEPPLSDEPPVIEPILVSPVQSNDSIEYRSRASGDGLLRYNWNFGDGSDDSGFSTLDSISHTFTSSGRYLISVTVRDQAGFESRETFVQMVHAPLNSVRPKSSGALAEIESRNELWTVNPDNNSVTLINTQTLARVLEVPVGEEPRALAVAPDGRLWVTNKRSASISIINPVARSVEQTLSLDIGSLPHGIVFGNASAYVALEGLATVVQLNANTGAERRRVFGGETARHLSLSSDNGTLYVSAFITPPLPGESGRNPSLSGAGGQVRVFRTSIGMLTADSMILLAHIDREISEHSGPGIPNYLGPMVISPDGGSAWVPSKQDNILAGGLRNKPGMTFDQTVRAVTSKIDMATGTEVLFQRVDHDNASVASHAAFGPNGLVLFTSLEGNRQVALIDVTTAIEVARFDVGRAPQSLLLSADGQRLYVQEFMDRSVGIYDISGVVLHGATSVERMAGVDTVANERLSSAVLRGKQLFHDARDDRLAALDYMSCASCHNEAGHDGRVWDFSSLGEGLRNTISLSGSGGTGNGLLHWSANFDEIQDFENQIRSFAGGSGLLSDAQFNSGTRADPLGDSKAGLSTDLDALAAYLESLDNPMPSPHRDVDGSLTAQAQSGKQLFATMGCAGCHANDNFTDSATVANLHDIGTVDADTGNALNGIDTPTLLELWRTAPYLHDGSAESIEAALDAHSSIALSPAQRADLTEFVLQLSEADAVAEPEPETITFESRLTGNANDAEQRQAGHMVLDSSDLELVYDAGGNQTIGLRFDNTLIPQGASIVDAYIQFQADEISRGSTTLNIAAQASDNAASMIAASNNITSRSLTAASVSWSPASWDSVGEAGPRQRSPQLRTLVQEVVTRANWVSGNALLFIISGTGERVAVAAEGASAGAPLLHIEYSAEGIDDTDTDGDGIPDIIDPDDDNDGTPDVDDPAPLDPRITGNTAPLVMISSPASGGAFLVTDSVVLYAIASDAQDGNLDAQLTWTSSLDGELGTGPTTISLSEGQHSITATVIDSGGLQATDSILLTVQAVDLSTVTIDTRVRSGADDAEERSSGKMVLDSTDLELVFDAGGNQRSAVRFTDLSIPQGATVVDAYIQFQADEVTSGVTNLDIAGVASDNAASMTVTNSDITSRVLTSASIPWSPESWDSVGEVGPGQRTPQLSAVVQEIVSRSGWNSGNAMMFIISGTGERVAEAVEGSAAGAALLHIEYTSTGGTNNGAPFVVESRISSSADDAEESATGSVKVDSSDLELSFDKSAQTVGMRFTDLTIPAGATITHAYVQFTVDESTSDVAQIVIKAELSSDAAQFQSINSSLSSRTHSNASVNWTPASWPTVGESGADQRTPDLTVLMQEVVDQAGWSEGNSLVLLVSGSGTRTAESHDGSSAKAPLLHVEYQTGPS